MGSEIRTGQYLYLAIAVSVCASRMRLSGRRDVRVVRPVIPFAGVVVAVHRPSLTVPETSI